MVSNATKEGLRYTDYGMIEMGFVDWEPRMYLLERLDIERLDVRQCNPELTLIPFVSQIFVVEKTEEVIRNLLEASKEGDSKAQ